MPDVLSSNPEVAAGAAASGLLGLFLLRRRRKKTIRISAPITSTPSDTPSPIPVLAPVDNPFSIGRFEGAEGLEVESRDDSSDEAVAVEVVRATLYPISGSASILDGSDNVVVNVKSVVKDQETNVKTLSLDAMELQTPYMALSIRKLWGE